MLTSTPVPISKPARIVSRGRMSTCQWKSPAPRGAVRTQRLSRGGGPSSLARAVSAVRIISVPTVPSRSKLGAGRRGITRSSNGERDEPLAAADLLRGDVLEQVPAGGALVIRGEALPLAGDRGRHEVEGVELSVGVLQRGAGLRSLVDDQVTVGGVRGVRAHA